jgi:hypothetical protein
VIPGGTDGGKQKMKKWECIQVGHHNDIGDTIEEYEKKGWNLHAYEAAGVEGMSGSVKHYLLFQKDVLAAPPTEYRVGNYNCPHCDYVVSSTAKTCPHCLRKLEPPVG